MTLFGLRSRAFVAAAAVLSGCGSGGTGSAAPALDGQSVVSASAVAPAARPVFASSNAHPLTSCPSQYTGGCFLVDAANPISFEWCVSQSGNCSSGLIANWTWSAVVTDVKTGKVLSPGKGAVTAVWNPNPDNPSTLTITTKFKKLSKKPVVKYSVANSTCEISEPTCYDDFVIYGIAN